MRQINKYFENRKIDYKKLSAYGFLKSNDIYLFKTKINNDNFEVIIEINDKKQTSKIVDLQTNFEYILVDVNNTLGDFSKEIKEEYENIILDIVTNCTTLNVFKSRQAIQVIGYIKENYNDELEYLWEKFPNIAVIRNKNNNKWYAGLFVLPEKRLGINSPKEIDVINLRYQKDKIKKLIDNEKIFAGYHMNKNNWITVKLDNSIDIKKIYELIDNSYQISNKT